LRQFTRTAAEIIPADTGLSLYQVHKGIENDPLQASPDTSLALENLRLELDNCFIKYQYYKTIGLDHARLIIKVNRAKYEAEEIDYLEFTKNLDEAYSVMLVYLETVNLYNQTAIELEYEAF
jgi:cobalt-zinc-cadmium resistance protein CzcA